MKNFPIALLLLVACFISPDSRAEGTIALNPERVGHTATLLPSGQVLIAGGINESGPLNSALLYDPVAQTFSATGNLTSARSAHTATLLNDGEVLLTGDENSSKVANTAEIYNPITGSFTQVSQQMNTARSKHTASLLPDGRVLLVGGENAEIFDPITQTFSVTVNAPTGRSSHAAVTLSDGKVLITGGYVGAQSQTDAWLYTPSNESFVKLAATMDIPRASHQMTLLQDGRVLVTGGFTGTSPQNEASVYDPIAQTFTSVSRMIYNRSNHQALRLVDGRVLVIGGITLESGFLAENEVWDPVTGTWSLHDTMIENRGGLTATFLLNGQILVAGGVIGNKTLATAEILDPVTHAFTSLGNTQVPRNQHTDTLLDSGEVLLAGGSTDAIFLDSAEVFNPSTNAFSLVGSLSAGRKSQIAVLLQNGKVLIAGGKSLSGDTQIAELYDPATKLFSPTGYMLEGRSLFAGTRINDGRVLVSAGRHGATPLKTAELYDPATGMFSSTGSMNTQRKRHRANLLNDGTVLVEGGASLSNGDDVNSGTPTAEIFNPGTGTWSQAGDMHVGRTEHDATLLPSGEVLVTGGLSFFDTSDLYNPLTKTFSEVAGLADFRQRHTALLLTNPAWGSLVGKVLIIGGATTDNTVVAGLQKALDSVEMYDPATAQMSFFGTMTETRQNHTAKELKDGRILIAGGVGRPLISGTAELLVEPTPGPTPAPTPTPTPYPTPSPSPTASPSPSPSASPSPTASPSPSPSPTATPSKPLNISTRVDTLTGDNVLIGGFIITGGTTPKKVLIRAVGPSLAGAIPGALENPILELHLPDGSIVTNDDWESDQKGAIEATGLAPTNGLEAAILTNLGPVDQNVAGSGIYTAIVKGKDGGTGVGLVEIYDLDEPSSVSVLANISTRGFVQINDGAMIGGFIIGSGANSGTFLIRAIGPSLAAAGIPDPLVDPTLDLYDSQGTPVGSNDEWQSDQQAAIEATGLAPRDAHESAILADLLPGAYTAIVLGKDGTSGVGLVEVYYRP